jgi:hypothetical protein
MLCEQLTPACPRRTTQTPLARHPGTTEALASELEAARSRADAAEGREKHAAQHLQSELAAERKRADAAEGRELLLFREKESLAREKENLLREIAHVNPQLAADLRANRHGVSRQGGGGLCVCRCVDARSC